MRKEYQLSFVPHQTDFPKDVKRIQEVMLENGYLLTLKESEELWDVISLWQDAGWLVLPEDDKKLFEEINNYLDEIR